MWKRFSTVTIVNFESSWGENFPDGGSTESKVKESRAEEFVQTISASKRVSENNLSAKTVHKFDH